MRFNLSNSLKAEEGARRRSRADGACHVRILILEDDPFIALDLQAIVEGDGHEVVGVFESLAEASVHLGDRFDFALLDIDVVDGKSFELAAALLEQRVPFAFVSASRPSEVPQHLRHARFIPKPFEEAAIVRFLNDPAPIAPVRN
jgi:DNA-binding response OmpR family regulator